MKTSLTPSWLRDLVAQCGFLDAYAQADPYFPEFASDLASYLDQAGHKLWDRLRTTFASTPDEVTLRNIWALASADPLLTGAIWRAASLQPNFDDALRQELNKLKSSFLEHASVPPWIEPIIQPTVRSPLDLSAAQEFTPSLRFRYVLAALTRDRFDALVCIRSIRRERRCSKLTRQRELKKAVQAAIKKSLEIRRITRKDFLQLPLMEQLVVSSDDSLLETVVDTEGVTPTALAKSVEAAWATHSDLRGRLLELLRGTSLWVRGQKHRPEHRLKENNVEFFNEHANQLAVDALDDDLRAEFASKFEKWLILSRDPSSSWVPLSENAVKLLGDLNPQSQFPSYLRLDAAEITRRFVTGELSAQTLRAADLEVIQITWTSKDREELARAGRITALDQLDPDVAATIFPQIAEAADSSVPSIAKNSLAQLVKQELCIDEAVDLLEQGQYPQLRQHIRDMIAGGSRTWAKAFRPYLGTETAAGLYNDPSWQTTEDLLAYLSHGSGIKDYNQYKNELSHLIGTELNRLFEPSERPASAQGAQVTEIDVPRWTTLAQTYASSFEDAAQLLVESLGSTAVIELLKRSATRHSLRKALEAKLSDGNALKDINRYRIEHVGTASELFGIVQEDAALIQWLRPELAEKLQVGTTTADVAALILCYRRSPRHLKTLAQANGAERFRSSVVESCDLLRERSRDRGYLELTAKLGARHVCTLAAVMASMDAAASAGHKLDKSYHHYALPKRSGGTRTVSAPNPLLKKVQKAILFRIISPLGAHPAAHGFVKGRSVGSNAALHVKRPVVSNCDIENCFPSVKWPLLLGALRRDVGKTLSPAAISLIVDITTMEGGLPIGAPTSPALLNRVLLMTDQTLSAAAEKRHCHYSRYADDLTFSGDHRAVELLGVAKRTLAQIGLALDAKKTNIYRRGRRQIVTGLVVNDRVSVPRRLRRRMRAAVHAAELGRTPTWHGQEKSFTSLKGRIAYLRSVNCEEGERLLSRLKSIGDESDE